MTGERSWSLINRSIDGDLSPEESVELESILASDPGARARHDQLKALHGALQDQEQAEVPANLKPLIMGTIRARQREKRDALNLRYNPSQYSGGRDPFVGRFQSALWNRLFNPLKEVLVGRKAFVGVGLVGVAGVLFFAIQGFPPTQDGAQGTIGTAQRHRAEQITTDDVNLNETTLDAALQNDDFQRVIASPEFRKLVANDNFKNLVQSGALEKLFSDPIGKQAISELGKSFGEAGKGMVEAGKGNVEAGKGLVEAGKGNVEAGKGNVEAGKGMVEAGKGNVEAGKGMVEAGKGNVEAGKGLVEAGKGNVEAGKGNVEAGKGLVEAGKGNVEAGKGLVEAGKGNIEAGKGLAEAWGKFEAAAGKLAATDPTVAKALADGSLKAIFSDGNFLSLVASDGFSKMVESGAAKQAVVSYGKGAVEAGH